MSKERKRCAAVSAQTGKPCKRYAADDSLVCHTHMGISKAQKDAMDKGRKKRHDNLKNGAGPTAKERWAQLLDGSLSVKDLDDEEINRMRVRGRGGEFSGGRGPAIPSHLARAFVAEQQVRWKKSLMDLVPTALTALEEILADDEHKDRSALLRWTLERAMGKTPDVVHVQTSTFEDVAQRALVDIDRGVAAGAEAILAEADRKDG